MKISEFEVGLAALGELDTITQFLTACRPSASKTVAAFSKGVAPALRDKQLDRSPSRPVDEILQDLRRALDRATALKANAFANDCKALLSALEGYSACDIDLIAQEIAAGPLPKPKKPAAKKSAKSIAELRQLADQLTAQSGSDSAKGLIEKISDKKQYSLKELKEIASVYLGFSVDKATHKRIIDMLHARNQQDALDASRRRMEQDLVL